jgi:prophage regulatory protein
MEERLIREPEVMQITGLKRTTMRTLIKRGRFPQPVELSDRTIAWPLSRVAAWIESRKPVAIKPAG